MEQNIGLMVAVIVIIVVDVISGIFKSFCLKDFSSSKMRDGLWHKSGSILIVVLSLILTQMSALVSGFPEIPIEIYIATCVYIIAMESMSIIENALLINPDLDRYKIMGIFKIVEEHVNRKEDEKNEEK